MIRQSSSKIKSFTKSVKINEPIEEINEPIKSYSKSEEINGPFIQIKNRSKSNENNTISKDIVKVNNKDRYKIIINDDLC